MAEIRFEMLQVYSYIWNKNLQMLTNQYTKKENIQNIP